MDFLGTPLLVWHYLVVELHTGVVVFVFLAIALRVLVDLGARGKTPSARVQKIRQGTDFTAYGGALLAVLFLIISGITGYLLQSYSTLISQPILLNKAFVALGALFFWAAFAFLRYWAGPTMWEKRGLYALAVVTALVGLVFTAVAGSIGAELSVGQSVMDPVYKALSINMRVLTLQPIDIGITAAVLVVGIIIAFLLKPARKTLPKQE